MWVLPTGSSGNQSWIPGRVECPAHETKVWLGVSGLTLLVSHLLGEFKSQIPGAQGLRTPYGVPPGQCTF